ncbi:hypothetical protein JOD82_001818 [Paenibacillus sp. 1182]|nr:hypothetical protein [Paenibacillus sp. 1182]MBP1308798.1 hypothetical protein [Paenibacillus sp. 1182]
MIHQFTHCGGTMHDWEVHYDGLCPDCVLEIGDYAKEDNKTEFEG